MAYSLFDACSAAGKCLCTTFITLDPKSPGVIDDGVVQHWSVNYDVQVRLMGTVLEAGSATVGDLVAALPGHPSPVEAIMALVHAGHLSRAPGVLTPFTLIFCDRPGEKRAGPNDDDNGPISSKKSRLSFQSVLVFPTPTPGKTSFRSWLSANTLQRGPLLGLPRGDKQSVRRIVAMALACFRRALSAGSRRSRSKTLVARIGS